MNREGKKGNQQYNNVMIQRLGNKTCTSQRYQSWNSPRASIISITSQIFLRVQFISLAKIEALSWSTLWLVSFTCFTRAVLSLFRWQSDFLQLRDQAPLKKIRGWFMKFLVEIAREFMWVRQDKILL